MKRFNARSMHACLEDAGASGLGDAQRAHAQLGHLKQPHVVGDGADQHRNLAVLWRQRWVHTHKVGCYSVQVEQQQ